MFECKQTVFNPFQTNVAFLYLNTRSGKMKHWPEMGYYISRNMQ